MTVADLSRLLVALLCVLCASPLAAAPTAEERVIAEALFDEARSLMKEEKWDAACPKLEESYRLDPLAGVLLNMAVCHEKQGRTATAWGEFKEALALAKIDRREDRERLAEEHIESLEPQLARVRIVVPDDARVDGLVVFRDDVELPEAAWDTPVPVDPGDHVIRAAAPGHLPREQTVTAVAATVIDVELSPLAREPLPEPVVVVPAPAPAPPPAPRPLPPPSVRYEPTPWPAVGWLLIGVGTASGIAAAGLGIHALVTEADAAERCSDNTCPDRDSLNLSNEAQRSAIAADVALAVAGGLAVAGVLVLVVAPAEVAVSPRGVTVGLRF